MKYVDSFAMRGACAATAAAATLVTLCGARSASPGPLKIIYKTTRRGGFYSAGRDRMHIPRCNENIRNAIRFRCLIAVFSLFIEFEGKLCVSHVGLRNSQMTHDSKLAFYKSSNRNFQISYTFLKSHNVF